MAEEQADPEQAGEQPDVRADEQPDAQTAEQPDAQAEERWTELGVRPETTEEWRRLGVDAFVAALAQGDGYGPSSARHTLDGLRAVSTGWREAGLDATDALRWHRAGFSPHAAAEWSARRVSVEDAALEAGLRVRG